MRRRTNLHNTNEFWAGWYEGLSKKFLSCSAAKVHYNRPQSDDLSQDSVLCVRIIMNCAQVLILAGTDRLDTELTIAQMQGKFRLVVLPECGHHIQEDVRELSHSPHLQQSAVFVSLILSLELMAISNARAQNPEKTAEILLELKKRYDIIASKTSPRITPTISHG